MALKILDTLSVRAQRMRTNIDEYLQRTLGNRDSGQSRIYRIIIDVVQDIAQLMFMYTANALREQNRTTATKETSIRGLAEVSGHSSTRPISSRGEVSIRKTGALQVGSYLYVSPNARLLCETNNLVYTMDMDTEKRFSLSNEAIKLGVIQGERKSQTFVIDATFDSTELYTVRLDDNEFIEHYSVKVKVNNQAYTRTDSLLDMGVGQKEYLLRNGFANQVDIIFGDATHGVQVQHGDSIEVSYIVTQGEGGILSQSDSFTVLEGFTDANGEELTEFSIKRTQGFLIASNGEKTEVTRNLIGKSSRALTFATPDNLKAYLSRLSILSHIDVYSDTNNDLINYIVALPKLGFVSSRDYLNVSEDKFLLTNEQKTAIKQMINASRRQFVSSEVVMQDPTFKRYGLLVYVDGKIDDVEQASNEIKDLICEHILTATFKSEDMEFDSVISNSALTNAVYTLDYINRVQINIFAEDNENAKNNGFYYKKETVIDGATRVTENVRYEVASGANPNIGLSELNDIKVEKGEIPILRPIGLYQNNTLKTLGSAITVFVHSGGTWRQL